MFRYTVFVVPTWKRKKILRGDIRYEYIYQNNVQRDSGLKWQEGE